MYNNGRVYVGSYVGPLRADGGSRRTFQITEAQSPEGPRHVALSAEEARAIAAALQAALER